MYALSPLLTLEHGFAFHPHLGRVAGHEELWRDVDARSTSSAETNICVVLRCQDDAVGVRGVVVRVGQFVQGILMEGGEVTCERWEFQFGDDGKDKGAEEEVQWKRTARTGDSFLPCAVAFRPQVLSLGGRAMYAGFEWLVEEVWEWK
jgi:hypothetical protein